MASYRSVYFSFGLCLLVATGLAVPLQKSSRDDHQISSRQTDNALCSSQNTALLPQANAYAQAALGKANGIYQTLNTFFKNILSSCQSTFTESIDRQDPHTVLVNTYDVTHFDVNFLPELESNHKCSHIQDEINSTISYLECGTNFIGLILQNLTSNIINLFNSSRVAREAVYEAYNNVSWIADIKKLTEVFPCARASPAFTVAACTSTYNDIQVDESDYPYNSCVVALLSSESSVYQKQLVVLAHITELFRKLKLKLTFYTGACLSN